jgi:stage III sporulation protein SpoIIIAA
MGATQKSWKPQKLMLTPSEGSGKNLLLRDIATEKSHDFCHFSSIKFTKVNQKALKKK